MSPFSLDLSNNVWSSSICFAVKSFGHQMASCAVVSKCTKYTIADSAAAIDVHNAVTT